MKKINNKKESKNMTNTNKRTIEGLRLIARDTQKMKVFDKVAYAWVGSSAVMNLLNKTNDYQDRYMKEFDIFQSACIKYKKIDVEALRKQALEIAEQNNDDESEVFGDLLNEEIAKITLPDSAIMEEIKNTIGYCHEVSLYDGSEWFNESEIDLIDYDDGNFGTFTLKEDEE